MSFLSKILTILQDRIFYKYFCEHIRLFYRLTSHVRKKVKCFVILTPAAFSYVKNLFQCFQKHKYQVKLCDNKNFEQIKLLNTDII